jgi:hypothetical protein
MATKKAEPKKMGRPPEAVPEDIAEELVEWISQGKTLREFCRLEGKPAWRTVYDWQVKDKEFSARIAHARELGHDAIAEETLEIIDTFPIEAVSDTGSRLDAGHVSWLKNRVEQRMKLLAKWNPKKYGDKVGVEHSGTVALDAAILEARKRVKQSD